MLAAEGPSRMIFGNHTYAIAEACGTTYQDLDGKVFGESVLCDSRELAAALISGNIVNDNRRFEIVGARGMFITDVQIHQAFNVARPHGAERVIFNEPWLLGSVHVNGDQAAFGTSDDQNTRQARAIGRGLLNYAMETPAGGFTALNIKLEKKNDPDNLAKFLPNVLTRREIAAQIGPAGTVTDEYTIADAHDAGVDTKKNVNFEMSAAQTVTYALKDIMPGSWFASDTYLPCHEGFIINLRRSEQYAGGTGGVWLCNRAGDGAAHPQHGGGTVLNGEPWLTWRARHTKTAEHLAAIDSVIGKEYRLGGDDG